MSLQLIWTINKYCFIKGKYKPTSAQTCESTLALISVYLSVDSEIGHHVLKWLWLASMFLCNEAETEDLAKDQCITFH